MLRRHVAFSLSALLLFFGSASVSGCKDSTKRESAAAEAAAPEATTAPEVGSVAPSAAPVASAPPAADPASLPADESGALTLVWKAANAAAEHVTVSIVAGENTLSLGKISAAADDEPGTVATCAMKNQSPTASRFTCGGTPAYNFYTASLTEGALVVTLTTGIDGAPSSEKVREVTRRPTAATTLHATGPASPALYGNCRVGRVQRTPDGICMRKCLKGNECTGRDTCSFITVKGTDGDHRVHACVPPGK